MLFCRLAGVFCSQFRSLSLFIVNFWCFIWYSVHFPLWHAEKTSLSKCQLCGLCCQDVRLALFFTFLGRGCVLCSPVSWCANWARKSAAQTLRLRKKSIYILNLNSSFKKKNTLNPQIYEVVSCELWLTLRRLESSKCWFLCALQISISIVNPLKSYSQTVMWNYSFSVFAGGLSTWQDNLCECKSYAHSACTCSQGSLEHGSVQCCFMTIHKLHLQ